MLAICIIIILGMESEFPFKPHLSAHCHTTGLLEVHVYRVLLVKVCVVEIMPLPHSQSLVRNVWNGQFIMKPLF